MEVDSFLKNRGVELDYSYEDLQRDLETLTRLGA
jgi:predicted HTH domain antitoxin